MSTSPPQVRQTWWWIAVGLASVVLVALGLPSVLTALVVAAAWIRGLARAYGAPVAVALTTLGWMGVTLMATVLATWLPFDRAVSVTLLQALSCFALLPLRGHPRDSSTERLPYWALLATLVGSAAWLLGVGVAMLSPRGAGLSWAVFIDASLDVSQMRRIVLDGGLDITAIANPRPLEHTLSSSMLPSGVTSADVVDQFVAEVHAHAMIVALSVAVASALAGLLCLHLTRTSRLRMSVRAALAALASLSMLVGPITGAALYRGQLNAHITWCLLFASVIVASRARERPQLTLAALVVSTTLLMLCWTPFAAVPALLALVVAWRHRGRFLADRRRTVRLQGPSLALFVWALALFEGQELINQAGATSAAREGSVTVVTLYSNPAWLPLFGALAAATCVVWWLLARVARNASVVACATVFGLVLGALPLFTSRGSLTGPLEYYPARYVHMASTALVPLLIAGLALLMVQPGAARRVTAIVAAAACAVLAVVAPMSNEVPKWSFVPVDIATGRVFGTHDELGDKVLSYPSSDTYRVAWHDDPPFDYFANWMLAMFDPVVGAPYGRDGQDTLRSYDTTQPASQACELAAKSDRTVVLVTSDPHVEGEISATCPDKGIRVELATAND